MADLDRTVWGTRWCWFDVMAILMEKSGTTVDHFFTLPEERQEDIMYKCQHVLAKCMEGGIMNDWNIIMGIAIDESGLESEIEDAFFQHNANITQKGGE